MVRSWRLAALVLACGLFVIASTFTRDTRWTSVVEFVVFVGLAYLMSPAFFPRALSAAEAQCRSAADGRAIVYWRPGCKYCLRLRIRLGRDARRAYWVNIWRDPAAAATVRTIADGNETVPTVVLAEEAYVNPEPAWLRDRLRAAGRVSSPPCD